MPVNVVLNEAVELAKRYGTAEGAAFVNGLLDRALTDLNLRLAAPPHAIGRGRSVLQLAIAEQERRRRQSSCRQAAPHAAVAASRADRHGPRSSKKFAVRRERGSSMSSVGPTVDEAIQQFLDHLRVERELTPATVEAYGSDLARFAHFAAGRTIAAASTRCGRSTSSTFSST